MLEDDQMYREGTEGTMDGQVKGDMYDIIKETKAGNLQSSTRSVLTSARLVGK